MNLEKDDGKALKMVLAALFQVNAGVRDFFLQQAKSSAEAPGPRTIKNAFIRDDSSLSSATMKFFRQYIPENSEMVSYASLGEELKEYFHKNQDPSQCAQKFSQALQNLEDEVIGGTELDDADYVNHLQNPDIAFHNPERQDDFFRKIRDAVKKKLGEKSALLRTVKIPGYSDFALSYLNCVLIQKNSANSIKCVFTGKQEPPPPDDTHFARMIKGPKAEDRPSFGVRGFYKEGTQWTIELAWSRYFASLERCDAYFMRSIYALGGDKEKERFEALANNVTRILENRGGDKLPILGVTTILIFKREQQGPYYTLIQLKEGGASKIPESHIAPSFVHQPVCASFHTLSQEAEEIESHCKRELIEEVFNFPENKYSDFQTYKKNVGEHFAIQALDELIAKKEAQFIDYGLVYDIFRGKFELIKILRIDNPSWIDSVETRIHPNYEAIKNGIILAPLTAEGIYRALVGKLTYGDTVVRRMCSPGQAALMAAVEHLLQLGDSHVQGITFESA